MGTSRELITGQYKEFIETGISIVDGYWSRVMDWPYDLQIIHQQLFQVSQARSKIVGGAAGGHGPMREFKDRVANTEAVIKAVPKLWELYVKTAFYINEIVFAHQSPEKVILSPDLESAITFKHYQGIGSTHGWHLETNGITGLYYLTNCDDGPLEYLPPDSDYPSEANINDVRRYYSRKDNLVILKGHNVWHQVRPMTDPNSIRACLVFNYYFEGDTSRPEGLNEIHYQ